MQQATQIGEQPKPQTDSPSAAAPAAGSSFVINLCSSTSPVALSPPDHAGLKRFTFFVSRRREEGRERFRLHMGFFETQEEAEKLLDIVREIYPGAWAGMAPGQRLRAAAAAPAPAAATVAPTASVSPAVPVTPAAPVAAAAAPAVAPIPARAPAAPVSLASAAASVAAPTTVATISVDAAPAAAPQASTLAPPVASFELVPDDRGRHDSAQSDEDAAARSLSEVRAAIASLDDTTVRKPILRIPELRAAPAVPGRKAVVAESPLVKAALQPAAAPGAAIADSSVELSEEGTIALLEAAPPAGSAAHTTSGARGAVTGDNSGSTPNTEKALFAVQLAWSVQPIDITQVPQLAIFSAYTLYGAEGNRDGRRWYGLRLGFFTDAVSAKQVAHYVRSEFSTVSVVPVTARERERAKLAASRMGTAASASADSGAAMPRDAKAAPPTAPAEPGVKPAPGSRPTPQAKAAGVAAASTSPFQFIEDKPLVSAGPEGDSNTTRVPPAARAAPGKRAKLRSPAQAAAARAKPKKLTLEETLEILGAGDLKVDDGRGELLNHDPAANAAAASRPQPAKAKPSRLGRLFERLSERIGN